MIEAWATYDQLPREERQVVMNSRREKLKDRLLLWNVIFFTYGTVYIVAGITAAETEKRRTPPLPAIP